MRAAVVARETYHLHDLLLHNKLYHAGGFWCHICRFARDEHHLKHMFYQHMESPSQAKMLHC